MMTDYHVVIKTLWELFCPYLKKHPSEFALMFVLQFVTTFGLTQFTFASRDFMNALNKRDRGAFMKGIAKYLRWIAFLAPMIALKRSAGCTTRIYPNCLPSSTLECTTGT